MVNSCISQKKLVEFKLLLFFKTDIYSKVYFLYISEDYEPNMLFLVNIKSIFVFINFYTKTYFMYISKGDYDDDSNILSLILLNFKMDYNYLYRNSLCNL